MTASVRLLGSPYRFLLLHYIFDLLELLLQPFLFVLNHACSPFVPTTNDLRHPILLRLRYFISILCLPVVVIMLPLAATLVCFKWIIHQFRLPYFLSINADLAQNLTLSQNSCDLGSSQKLQEQDGTNKFRVTVGTMNTCLLPELWSKFNNLDDPKYRGFEIGRRICADQVSNNELIGDACSVGGESIDTDKDESKEQIHDIIKSVNKQDSDNVVEQGLNSSLGQERTMGPKDPSSGGDQLETVTVKVLTKFRRMDIVCLQEMFDRRIALNVVRELHKEYPWIVSDVGYTGMHVNRFGMNSGLMVASRYEIVNVDFKCFEAKCGLSLLMNKGLLMVKVRLDGDERRSRVGYIFNTHLEAFSGDQPIVESELSDVETWTQEFRKKTIKPNEVIVFDVLCGDFNMDNMSPGEAHLTTHNVFNIYADVCRERPGKDFDWTIGTSLRTPNLHDAQISSPEGLKAALEDPCMRQIYVFAADIEKATMDALYAAAQTDEHGNVVLSPVGGRRRIDLVLYRKENPVVVLDYSLVTRLAPLTDHVPVTLTFQCQP